MRCSSRNKGQERALDDQPSVYSDDNRHTSSYSKDVKPLRWNPEKNRLLDAERGITFERVVVAIANEGLLDVYEHPNKVRYPNQRVLVVACDGYAYLVPFVEDADHLFLKTVIPSRQATRDYLSKHNPEIGER